MLLVSLIQLLLTNLILNWLLATAQQAQSQITGADAVGETDASGTPGAVNIAGSDTTGLNITLDDWDGEGYQAPIVQFIVAATISGIDITGASGFTEPIVGDTIIASDATVNMVERLNGDMRIRRSGSGRMDAYFDNEGAPQYPDAKLFIQTAADGVAIYSIFGGGNAGARWSLDTGENSDVLANIVDGTQFLLAVAEPDPIVEGDGETGEIDVEGGEAEGLAGTVASGTTGAVDVVGGEAEGSSDATGAGTTGAVQVDAGEAEGESDDTRQSFVLGALPWTGAHLIDPIYVVGGATAYLRYVARAGNSIQLRVAANTTDDPFLTGPQLVADLIESASAFTFTDSAGPSFVATGPDSPNSSFQDPSEPYFWTPAGAFWCMVPSSQRRHWRHLRCRGAAGN